MGEPAVACSNHCDLQNSAGFSGHDDSSQEKYMAVRAIRGATTVAEDDAQIIRDATRELIQQIISRNTIPEFDEIISAIFTTTEDLTAAFPAEGARDIGMNTVPLLCAREIPVVGSVPRCIRVLLHVNTELRPAEIQHVYLGDARKLRPDVETAE